MFDFIVNYIFGWYGLAGLLIAGCVIVAVLIPQFRIYALLGIPAVLAFLGAYNKGQRDRAALEQRRKDEAVRKAQADYDRIERRPDKPSDVQKRMRDGTF